MVEKINQNMMKQSSRLQKQKKYEIINENKIFISINLYY